MIISNLNYLEVVSETSSVVGGKRWIRKPKPTTKTEPKKSTLIFQSNVSVINQTATASSVAISTDGGDASSKAVAVNIATVTQSNR